ncbi:interleukin-1 receptor-associated kinase 1-binding protein 1 homolog [Callorhinchus milii]|uniref:Interleukin-1 receptor-associated kinase 1-binding protein 1 n=1 Tax=Callorhinchus milii TaxID=7868 RepID=V9KR72_CALMI|nr:interleukin-1 receptor-associated kinase 1-binding protein 1 homolog [Callorhinchus milii]|eukprot:gi/632979697/ref/XP_007906614.1/ PREDICTED: interleukin-1 receptor-associated kinase 1-binding protein 1 [Callorhinchus milii]
MALAPAARVFAALVPASDQENARGPELRGRAQAPEPGRREVHVSSSAELSAPPDRARVRVLVWSRKEAAAEARSSVSRRVDYISQSARGLGLRENNVTVTKDIRRVENAYQMETEICVIFSDFGKMQNLCNLLVEKLDSSVIVSSPQFYHTAEAVENIRRQACLTAVANARCKAQEVCRLLGQSLGRPLVIREEEVKESEGLASESASVVSSRSPTIQQQISNASVTVNSKVFVSFELKSKDKLKRNN